MVITTRQKKRSQTNRCLGTGRSSTMDRTSCHTTPTPHTVSSPDPPGMPCCLIFVVVLCVGVEWNWCGFWPCHAYPNSLL